MGRLRLQVIAEIPTQCYAGIVACDLRHPERNLADVVVSATPFELICRPSKLFSVLQSESFRAEAEGGVRWCAE